MTRTIFALIAGLFFCAHLQAAEKIRVSVTNYNLSYLAAGVVGIKAK